MNQKEMLLVLPVPFKKQANELYFETQACNGLEQWADNFSSVIVAAPLIPEKLAEQDKTMTWCHTATLAKPERFELVPLPWAYSLPSFISTYASVRVRLKELISRSHYLQFAIGGLFGDWAAVAAIEAYQQGRPYAIHTDRVEHKVILQTSKQAKLKTRLKAQVIAPLMAKYHELIIKNCSLGLWHGEDCYEAYSPFCNNSYLIHNIHTKPSDVISELEINEKINNVLNDDKIHICYAGRMAPMKAPMDWVQAIGRARDLGVNLHATWIGDGPLFKEMRASITNKGLDDCIELVGFETNREQLFKRVRAAHIMLFTHITPESPRCLIESLVCGTPIVGYGNRYPENLVKGFGGGMFAPINDWQKLGELIAILWKDRQLLSQLIKQAARNGSRFNDQQVFRERSDLIKKHLL